MQVVLLSTYDLGHQPFGLASPAAWLRSHHHNVTCADLAVDTMPDEAVRSADLVAIYLPMHTAARLAVAAIQKAKLLNSRAHLCCYGLYAPLNEQYLRDLGVSTIIGGEFEAELVALADGLRRNGGPISLERLRFHVPDRSDLPPLESYASLRTNATTRLAGYTEASRGCKHRCRHCPVVPVYNGTFRVVQLEVVLEDVRRQVAAGARHITFGDPDFLNGPTHAMQLVDRFHAEFPSISYDATIKIEHLRQRRRLLPELKRTGCLFVTSAVESLDDEVLRKLDKGHTRQDFLAVVRDFHELGLTLSPTFIAFMPWTTLEGYREFLRALLELDLIENISPVQLALRLLIPAGSRLLELEEVQAVLQGWNAPALLHCWKHPDAAVDTLAAAALKAAAGEGSRRQIFARIWELAHGTRLPDESGLVPRATIPYLDEPWYC